MQQQAALSGSLDNKTRGKIFMWYILTFMAGGMFGVFFMCLFQINRQYSQTEYGSTPAKQKGGSDEKDGRAS